MASIKVLDYIDIGTGGVIDSVSYQIYKIVDGLEKVVDESLKDNVNIDVWHSMLPKLKEDLVPGESKFYSGCEGLRARVKIHIGPYESKWFEIEGEKMENKTIEITENGKPTIITSIEKK